MKKVLASFLFVFAFAVFAHAAEGDVDQAGQMLTQATASYAKVQNYEANFERKFYEEQWKQRSEKMYLRFEKPFTIYMNWQTGSSRGQQLLFSEGNFDDKLLAKPPGFLFNLIPIVSLATDDPRVTKGEKHSIKDAGIGVFLEDFIEDFEKAKAAGKLNVRSIEDGTIEGEPVTWVRVDLGTEEKYPHKDVAFSKANGLPIQMDLFNPQDKLVETYSYLKLKIDTPRDNPEFRRLIDPRMWDYFKKVK